MYPRLFALFMVVMMLLGFSSCSHDSATAQDNTAALDEAIGKVTIFAGLTTAERIELRAASTLRTGKAGDVVIEQGKPLSKMLVILDGTSEVWINGSLLLTLTGQNLFGEVEFLDSLAGSADVKLATGASILELDNAALIGVMDRNPRIGYVVMREIAKIEGRRLRAMDEQK